MELNALGAIMKFALDREQLLAGMASEALNAPQLSAADEFCNALATNSRKNSKLLERTRRENINEIVIEPISGMNVGDFTLDPQPVNSMTSEEFTTYAAEVMDSTIRFYTVAVAKIPNEDVCRNLAIVIKKTTKVAQQL
jgi:hypothetical protein